MIPSGTRSVLKISISGNVKMQKDPLGLALEKRFGLRKPPCDLPH
jgi:hypothetical protein